MVQNYIFQVQMAYHGSICPKQWEISRDKLKSVQHLVSKDNFLNQSIYEYVQKDLDKLKDQNSQNWGKKLPILGLRGPI